MAQDRVISIPSPSLVVTVGPSGCGKSVFCARHFNPADVVSSEACRARLDGEPPRGTANRAAFALAHALLDDRLRRCCLSVFDARNLDGAARTDLLALAARHHLPAIAVIFDLSEADCLRHDARRPGRSSGGDAVVRQAAALKAALPRIADEGFADVHHVRDPVDAMTLRLEPRRLPCDRENEPGPFDVIGDVHGCERELSALLTLLGYRRRSTGSPLRHPDGRRVVFVGDLVDRGPRIVQAATLAMDMVEAGSALCVAGNHEEELALALRGELGEVGPGTDRTLEQLGVLNPGDRDAFTQRFLAFADSLPSHLLLDRGRLVVAHAGLRAEYIGRDSPTVRRFALHGETTGALDEHGLPVRVNWAAVYAGYPLLVYGHTPVRRTETQGNSINIDTGCVYGGTLTALRYPERILTTMRSARAYYQSPRLSATGVGLRADTRFTPSDSGH